MVTKKRQFAVIDISAVSRLAILARHDVHTFLAVILYILQLSLSAASPAFRGTLVDLDCRWSIISGSVDDRTKEELGEEVTKPCLQF